jgi:hypothetical protein
MRKNLFVRANSLYITIFVLAASTAQAATPRTLDPQAWSWVRHAYLLARRAFDVLQFPIG